MDDFLQNALSLVDSAMARYSKRDLVSASEVTDLLLDVRWMMVESAKQRDEAVLVS